MSTGSEYFELCIKINPEMEDIVSEVCFEEFPCEGVVLAEETYKDLEMVATTEGTLRVFLNPYMFQDDLEQQNALKKCKSEYVSRVLTEKRELLKSRGFSDDELLKDKRLLKYAIAIALRKNNENPHEVNIPTNGDIKRIIALPIFSVDDKSLFHEINHAICSEFIMENGESIIKCGLDYSNDEKKYITEIINDITSLEIYNIFKSKCSDAILDDNIMKEVFTDTYKPYHHLITDFYEQSKDRIKASIIDASTFQIEKNELESISKSIHQQGKNK